MPGKSANPMLPPRLVELLASTESVTVLTGSGISAESGVPTFREAQTGLWAQYNPHDLATPEAFDRNPRLVWQWYEWRRQLISDATPNLAHTALAKLENLVHHFQLITQNVDGLHQMAGNKSIIELHGNIHRIKCSVCERNIENREDEGQNPPHCPFCDGLLRPDVVWFGESLPHPAFDSAMKASQNCELFFSIGTSSVVQPAASLATLAYQSGASLIEINLDQTPLTPIADFVLNGPAGQIMSALVRTTFHS